MQATQRRFEPSVIERLFAAPHRFQFFQAVRMIELWFKRNGIPHERAVSDFLRFANRTVLGFPQAKSRTSIPFHRAGTGLSRWVTWNGQCIAEK
jgi:predicted component of type VI protein secretion system